MLYKIKAPYSLSESQRTAVEKLSAGFKSGNATQVLKGVTGCGKTFMMANLIAELERPVLVLSHNKTLAAQLYREFKSFFPDNAVEYFVSTYDYYQPEAYIPGKDLYIEKEVDLNSEIDRLRLRASFALLERPDTVVVSTVSCIYGLGSPQAVESMAFVFSKGETQPTRKVASRLCEMQYSANQNGVLSAGEFSLKGDLLELIPAGEENILRIEFDFDEIAGISFVDPLNRSVVREFDSYVLYPAKQFVLPKESIDKGVGKIRKEMEERVSYFLDRGKPLEAERIRSRVEYDLDMLEEVGYCSGIENYSRPLQGRPPGSRPSALLDYFPKDFVVFIDESHVTVSQIGAMYEGDRSRKQTLVDYGFRLPSALDNRPLKYEEFDSMVSTRLYVSATPGERELSESQLTVEQVLRPTGLLDPTIEVRSEEGQVDDLHEEIRKAVSAGERVLVTTLTKKMAEDLCEFYKGKGLKVAYLHSEIDTMERVGILKDLRLGKCDVLIGINLLREGLDLPEVSLIAILDADKMGFLRSTTSLIQIIGRAARNERGRIIMYANSISRSMREAIDETARRRRIQSQYNEEHGVVPHTVHKEITDILDREEPKEAMRKKADWLPDFDFSSAKDKERCIKALEKEMRIASKSLEFEKAIALRDEINRLKGAG